MRNSRRTVFFSSNSYYICLHFVCFAEWLVDRKRIPADWRKRLTSIRARISTAVASLPKEIDPYFQTLDAEGSFWGYHCDCRFCEVI